MLYIQYRMQPEICTFPSKQFYKNRLLTNPEAAERRSKFQLKHYLMFNLSYGQEIDVENTGSIYNDDEATFALNLCEFITKRAQDKTIGIITPYQKQVHYLKDLLSKSRLHRVEVGTVDSFQGREKDIIVFSCVRANNSKGSIGFVGNRQRLNVSLTRARNGLFIICNKKSLKINEDWDACIRDAEERNVVVNVENKNDASNFRFSQYLNKT